MTDALWESTAEKRYAVSTKIISQFVVHSCVAFSFAGVTKTNYFPILDISKN
jgi:hypothetical protein